MRRIKFIATGHSILVGNFSAGDIATIDANAASHLVHAAGAAVYDDEPAQEQKPEQQLEQQQEPQQEQPAAADAGQVSAVPSKGKRGAKGGAA